MAYDVKFKKRTIEYHEEGNSIRQTSKTFGISPNTLNTWLKQYRSSEGELGRKIRAYDSHKISEEALLAYLEAAPDPYLFELAEYFGCSISTVWRSLKRLKITLKKR